MISFVCFFAFGRHAPNPAAAGLVGSLALVFWAAGVAQISSGCQKKRRKLENDFHI
jgi:hypothetical protein